MTYRNNSVRVASVALVLTLSACGGGGGSSGGGGLVSMPPPPPPPNSSAVDIFASPATQEFAVISVGDNVRIRYDAPTNKYEVMAGSQAWKTLVDDPSHSPLAGNPNTSFVMSGSPSYFRIGAHRDYPEQSVQYHHSNLAYWADGLLSGVAAFGILTPAGGVPVTGSATYQGTFGGIATETYPDDWSGEDVPGFIQGAINLTFDFGGGSLSGSISPSLYLGDYHSLGTLNFANTVYSSGSTNFSGAFDTPLTGANSFAGRFTGPNAQELIGNFAFPYLSPIDGLAQEAEGAFIAKR